MNTKDIESFSNEIKAFHRQVAENVKRERNAKGISQLELSLRMGYKSTSVVSHAEADINGVYFSIVHLYQIARILDVDISCFFRGTAVVLKTDK